MITFSDWLKENEFTDDDIKNGDIVVYSEDYVKLNPIWDDIDDSEVIDSYSENGVWVVIVDYNHCH